MTQISWWDLAWCAIPVAFVLIIYQRWCFKATDVVMASARMVLQLVGVGYVLVVLFGHPSPWITSGVLCVMAGAASWIAIRPVGDPKHTLLPVALGLLLPVSFHLFLSIYCVLKQAVWYHPQVIITLAGMFLANTMNAISLAVERYLSEYQAGKSAEQARLTAYRAAMIPQINSLLAVGLVALPGMMTGQILSGVSPLVAVRYQIMIMTMMLGTCGCGAALTLWLLQRKHVTTIDAR